MYGPIQIQFTSFIFLLITCVVALPFLNEGHLQAKSLLERTREYVQKLEQQLDNLRWSQEANEKFQTANRFILDLIDENKQKADNGTFDDCRTISCPSSSIRRTVSSLHSACVCIPTATWRDLNVGKNLLRRLADDTTSSSTRPRKVEKGHVKRQVEDVDFTYIPPPKADITPALIAQSLTSQPQDTATIVSVMPYFADDVVIYGIQMNGFVASTLSLNASALLSCGGIGGSMPLPELELRPKDIINGTAQAYVPDCSVIAINMYNPNVINYWVQAKDGSMYSMVGSNKLVDLDKLNTAASVSLVLRAKQLWETTSDVLTEDSQKVGSAIAERAINRKAIVPPDFHTASMTAEACTAIRCNNNGGEPAIYNQFTSMCGCRQAAFVEVDHAFR